jgi:transcription antitermination factor NusG
MMRRRTRKYPNLSSEAEVFELLNEGVKTGEVPQGIKRVVPEIRFTVGEHVKVIDGRSATLRASLKRFFRRKDAYASRWRFSAAVRAVELDYLQVGKCSFARILLLSDIIEESARGGCASSNSQVR